jgi:glycosyltransferase involved in cell wall biosynthesis
MLIGGGAVTISATPLLSVVLPCRNEQGTLPALRQRLTPLLERLTGGQFEVIVVDDGSTDASPDILDAMGAEDARVKVVHLSRSFGHQAALSAGLDASRGTGVVLMDCDLQDPPEVIEQFVERWRAGYDVVYGIRRRRKERLPKRLAYAAFYRSMRVLAQIDVPLDAGDFCLMDRKVVDVVVRLPEANRFLRGLRSWVGFRQTGVEYERQDRHAGESKYPVRDLVGLAVSGYVGFSTVPLRIASWLGLAVAAVGFLLGIPAPWGWASTMAVILFLGGIQLLVLGVVGEYLGRVYDDVRARPAYVVDRTVGFGEQPRPAAGAADPDGRALQRPL